MEISTDDSILDVAGVGFGPSNIALAIALGEWKDKHQSSIEMKFFEKQASFGWHRGMLIEDATMQVSFLKDLATMRNPQSRYTFVSYLKDKERMAQFINNKTLFPLRVEFHDYLEWVADHLSPLARYGSEIVRVAPVFQDGRVEYLDLEIRIHGDVNEVQFCRTRNIILGTGLSPNLPNDVKVSERIWHSSQFLEKVSSLTGSPRRFVVVGAGQSAAETANYLHVNFPHAEIDAVFSRYGYSVSDDSPFANSIFDPDAIDDFYYALGDVKKDLLRVHSNTNYSVVDLALAEDLYGRAYKERVLGRERLRVRRTSHVRSIEEHPKGVSVTIEYLPDGSIEVFEADAVVYATGYRPSDPTELLKDLLPFCKLEDEGRLALDRDYRVITSSDVGCGVYVHGAAAEHTHGLSAGLLSNAAVRAGEIADSIMKR